MFSLRISVVFVCLIAMCYCDTSAARKKTSHGHHHHKHLFFHEFHFLLFLALKFKVILVLGTIWTFAIFFGKVFAALKLAEYMKKNYYHEDHHEKIIYMPSPHGSYEYPGVYGKSYTGEIPNEHHPGSTFSADFSSSGGFPGGDFGGSAPGQVYDTSPPGVSGRKEDGNDGGIFESISAFSRIIRKLNTTELAFRDMHLSSEECKRKFVCEAEFNVKQSSILKTAYELLSDDSYQKYKANQTVTTIEDCARLNPACLEDTTRLVMPPADMFRVRYLSSVQDRSDHIRVNLLHLTNDNIQSPTLLGSAGSGKNKMLDSNKVRSVPESFK